MVRPILIAALLLAAPTVARADRSQVYSVQGADCASCAEDIKRQLKKVKGIGKVDFDKHVAIRKLNVRDFDTPRARELGSAFETLPYVVVLTPKGKRIDVVGTDFEALDKALQRRESRRKRGTPSPAARGARRAER